jgi:uncharacterized repeat protein (TIGR03847 family)
MRDIVEFNPVDSIAAGAVGEPGHRSFYIQASKEGAKLTVLVEKEQVALLAERIGELLSGVAAEHPEDPLEVEASLSMPASLEEPLVPLFRATLMGIGFDAERSLVLLELHEQPPSDDEPIDPGEAEGHVARLFATRTQIRAMAARSVEAVAAGRPPCPLCGLPMDAVSHVCPATNGHAKR